MSKWEEKMLGELIISSKGKLTKQSEFLEDGFQPLINADAINGRATIFSDTKGAVLCEEDDVLMLWDGERSGLVTFGFKGVVGSTFAKLKTLEALESKYLFYFLNEKFLWIQNNRTGTGVPHVPKDLERILIVKYPKDKTEQRQIATILSTADAVIEKTQAAIAKYKGIKQGMLQDLFTRGIDITTGKLRPSYQDAQELYKESKLGWIPKEWEVERLEKLCSENPTYGINAKAVDFTYQLPTYIRITDIDEEGNFSKTERKCVDSPFSNQYILKKGDLVFARTGATVGKTYLYNEADGILIFAGFLIKVSTNEKLLDSYFLKYLTETPYYLKWVGLMSQRSGQPGINGNEYGSFLVPKPNLQEQKLIAERLNLLNQKLQTEQNFLHKQQQIKAGLMNDLLSGKRKVKSEKLEEEVKN